MEWLLQGCFRIGDEIRMCTSRAPPFRSNGTSLRSVFPRTSESSTITTLLPSRF